MIRHRDFVGLLLCWYLSSACSPKAKAPTEELDEVQARAAATDASPSLDPESVSPLARARDWLCPVVGQAPRQGFFGPQAVPRPGKMHAGIRAVQLRSDEAGALLLSLLAEDDIDNERGLNIKQGSPPRSVHVFRLLEDTWQDLGRPFQFMGWNAKLDVSIGQGPMHVALEAGLGDVRRSLAASCEASAWQQEARYVGKNFESAALLSRASMDDETMANIEIVRGRAGLQGAACQTPGAPRAADLPLRLTLPWIADPALASIDLALPNDCRVARNFIADALASEVVVSYELCSAEHGAEHVSFGDCQIATLWFSDAGWRRMPSIGNLGADEVEARHALALGQEGPLLAVTGAKGLALYQAKGETWTELPPLKATQCRLPVALQSDPPRLVSRGCAGDGKLEAHLLEAENWRAITGTMKLKPVLGDHERPVVAATWIGETAYVAVGHHGAPVVRVFASAQQGWLQLLQAQVDAHAPAAPTR